jgi:hypothetical protein
VRQMHRSGLGEVGGGEQRRAAAVRLMLVLLRQQSGHLCCGRGRSRGRRTIRALWTALPRRARLAARAGVRVRHVLLLRRRLLLLLLVVVRCIVRADGARIVQRTAAVAVGTGSRIAVLMPAWRWLPRTDTGTGTDSAAGRTSRHAACRRSRGWAR